MAKTENKETIVVKTDALLQELRQAMGYSLLSDMHTNKQRIGKLQKAAVLLIPRDRYPLEDWNRAVGYVTGENLCCKTVEDAIVKLFDFADSKPLT